jgi:hypothetical protein
MAENSTKKIKVITAPDIIFDQAQSILVVTPAQDLKEQLELYAVELNDHINIYVYTGLEKDIKWLLTTAKMVDYIVVDIDNLPEEETQFLSYILSLPNTYYRCLNMRSQWMLLNKNRFYNFPNFSEGIDERT